MYSLHCARGLSMNLFGVCLHIHTAVIITIVIMSVICVFTHNTIYIWANHFCDRHFHICWHWPIRKWQIIYPLKTSQSKWMEILCPISRSLSIHFFEHVAMWTDLHTSMHLNMNKNIITQNLFEEVDIFSNVLFQK